MPGYDGMGPQGTGPNGRGLGPCGQESARTRWDFLGLRRGRLGRGRGFRWFSSIPSNEKEDLETEKRWLKEQLNAIDERIDQLKQED